MRRGFKMSGQFSDRVVIVTGGARGIGDAVVRAFLRQGARVVSIDLIEPDDAHDGVRYLAGDVSDRVAMEAVFGDIGNVEGTVDVLVNNAGLQAVGRTREFDPAVWQKVLDVHLGGTFHCSALALGFMEDRKRGSIVSISSAAAIVGVPGRGPYTAAKGAISAFTRELAVEVAEQGIRVNAVAPGSTLTKLVQQGFEDGSTSVDWIIDEIPMRRLAHVDEIAKVVRFLAGDEASYITGQTVVVDGGWTVQGMRHRPDWL